ncbi:hypothetical protein GB931_15970 [Modestobacter sp. I12A-02628]|uniref:Fibronectin type-III domain-containing protein n=1 Tax=Goekera deserti TaxID=2497753 RepID=A0A7K3WGT0_9ACTN|nr:hypothetical protein [Goekera deserti]MPQ99388.1 hypothetical protein [Goekera deserti]NDI48875.1 hypothetical protein [Goekera deserti]NEL55654.1 hypothetical protein [Goekera deserti]
MTSSAGHPTPGGTRSPAPRRAPRPGVVAARRRREERRARWYGTGLSLAAVCLTTGFVLSVSPVDLPGPTAVPSPAAVVVGVAPVAPNGTVPVPSQDAVPAAPTRAQPVMPLPAPDTGSAFVPYAPYGVPPTFAPPTSECGGYGNPRQITPGIEVGPGQATASWQADGRDAVIGYRVTAVTLDLVGGAQPEPPTQTVGQRDDCGPVSVTITGLPSGGRYVFWLEEQVVSSIDGVARFVQVGWSPGVVIG